MSSLAGDLSRPLPVFPSIVRLLAVLWLLRVLELASDARFACFLPLFFHFLDGVFNAQISIWMKSSWSVSHFVSRAFVAAAIAKSKALKTRPAPLGV